MNFGSFIKSMLPALAALVIYGLVVEGLIANYKQTYDNLPD